MKKETLKKLKEHPEIREIFEHREFQKMDTFKHHKYVTCLEHTILVAEKAYRIARRLNLDAVSAARGALLHDFYLYDWHTDSPGFHGFKHPAIALKNARIHFSLNDIEENIILRHMWPLTPIPPKYREAMIVSMADKLVAIKDYSGIIKQRKRFRIKRRARAEA